MRDKIKVLLVNSFSSFKVSGVPFKLPNPSIAGVYAICKQAGFETDLCDLNMFNEPNLMHMDDFFHDLSPYDVIGVSVGIDTLKHVRDIITYIKEIDPDLPVIIGGPPIFFQPDIWLKETGADIAVIGEAEVTLPELCIAIAEKSDLTQVDGIIFNSKEQLIKTKTRQNIKNIDQVPFPDYSLFNLELYFANPNFKWLFNNKKGLFIMSSRGCPYTCSFCCSGGGMRTIKTGIFINEIQKHFNKYNLESVFIRDDIFTYNQERARAISSMLGKIKASWLCMTRPNLLCRKGDRKLLEHMKKNGCDTVMIGIESYNQKILDINCKGVTISEIDRSIENCIAAGIRTIAFIIFGLPGETEKTIQNTFGFIQNTGIEMNANILQPLPGSKIYSDALYQGIIDDEIEYLRNIHLFWDLEDYLPVNMTALPDEVIIQANIDARKFKKFN
jgi:anaerobic magnesium-protoporphyrin IX monomethyl ester cyclase